MKKMKKLLYVLLIAVLIMPVIPAISTGAATTKTPAPAYNGKWTYYAVYNTIYKLNSQDGTAKKVKEIKGASIVSDISYYDGYLYFAANYYAGTDGADSYVCRMKNDGTAFTKLVHGSNPVVYDKKIYYFKTSHIRTEYNEYDDIQGIAVMSLAGKNSKLLVKNSTVDYMQWTMGVAGGKVYYTKYFASSEKYAAMSYDTKTGEIKKLFATPSGIQFVNCDTSYAYFSIDGIKKDAIGVYEIKTGKLIKKTFTGGVSVLGGKNGTVYFSRYSTNSTYAYHVAKDQVTTILNNKRLTGIIFSKNGYQVAEHTFTQEEFEKSGYKYDLAVVRVKLDGTGFKILKKYYMP